MNRLETLNIRDPFVLVDQGKYYLYAAGEEDGRPCFQVRRSSDMENFEDPVTVFRTIPSYWGTQDFWAPEVHRYQDRFYLFASFKAPGKARGTSILVADRPEGPFQPVYNGPVTPAQWECLDGTFWCESGVPYILFCREWLQVKDGEIYIARLKTDLSGLASDPILLFKGSQAKWTAPFCGEGNYVTDGPFLFRKDGSYELLWSSFSQKGYALGIAKSKTLFSGWVNADKPIYDHNGGHGMVFEDHGRPTIIIHSPNGPGGKERPTLLPLNQVD
jgi:arabinan endo-1,5-alpha-L-arabinosidase